VDAQRQPFQRILVPTDLGGGAERALARVPWLPLAENASIFLLHCVPDESAGPESARTALDAAATDLERNCRQRGALVALGTNSRTAVERWLLGSVAETVLRAADCDVLVASDL